METTILLKKKIIYDSEIKVNGATEEVLVKLADYIDNDYNLGIPKSIADIKNKVESLGMEVIEIDEKDCQGTEYEYVEDDLEE